MKTINREIEKLNIILKENGHLPFPYPLTQSPRISLDFVYYSFMTNSPLWSIQKFIKSDILAELTRHGIEKLCLTNLMYITCEGTDFQIFFYFSHDEELYTILSGIMPTRPDSRYMFDCHFKTFKY